MTALQRDLFEECVVSDAQRLIAMCRRLASRKAPSLSRTRLVQISEHLEMLVEQAQEAPDYDEDLPLTY
jgi:hypothetical protein